MEDLEKEVFAMLVPIFPNLTSEVIVVSVRHPSNHAVPLTRDILLQRCIDDLLELRTFTEQSLRTKPVTNAVKPTGNQYRQPAAIVHSDGSSDSDNENQTTISIHVGAKPNTGKDKDVMITGHTPAKNVIVVTESSTVKKEVKPKLSRNLNHIVNMKKKQNDKVVSKNSSADSSAADCPSNDMYREIDFSSDSDTDDILSGSKLLYSSDEEEALPVLSSPMKALRPSSLVMKGPPLKNEPDFSDWRDTLTKSKSSNSVVATDKCILEGRNELKKSQTVPKIAPHNTTDNAGVTINVNNKKAMKIDITVNVSGSNKKAAEQNVINGMVSTIPSVQPKSALISSISNTNKPGLSGVQSARSRQLSAPAVLPSGTPSSTVTTSTSGGPLQGPSLPTGSLHSGLPEPRNLNMTVSYPKPPDPLKIRISKNGAGFGAPISPSGLTLPIGHPSSPVPVCESALPQPAFHHNPAMFRPPAVTCTVTKPVSTSQASDLKPFGSPNGLRGHTLQRPIINPSNKQPITVGQAFTGAAVGSTVQRPTIPLPTQPVFNAMHRPFVPFPIRPGVNIARHRPTLPIPSTPDVNNDMLRPTAALPTRPAVNNDMLRPTAALPTRPDVNNDMLRSTAALPTRPMINNAVQRPQVTLPTGPVMNSTVQRPTATLITHPAVNNVQRPQMALPTGTVMNNAVHKPTMPLPVRPRELVPGLQHLVTPANGGPHTMNMATAARAPNVINTPGATAANPVPPTVIDDTPDKNELILVREERPETVIIPEESGEEMRTRNCKDNLRREMVAMFPDVDPSYVDQLYDRFQFMDWQLIINNVCNHLLENPNYPKKTTAAVAVIQQAEINNKDYYKEYSDHVDSTYRVQCENLLMTEFKWISLKDIRKVMSMFNYHYAPSHKALTEIMSDRAEKYAQIKDKQPHVHAYSQATAEAKVIGVNGEKIISLTFLKCGRPFRSDAIITPELEREKEFIKARAVEETQVKDHEMAVSVNEHEYEETGQLIECGCCYGEVAFERMVQCYDGHLFCQECLERYAQESVFGHGKADLLCMTDGCDASFPLSQLQKALPSNILSKYEDRVQEENINLADLADLVRCPNCDFAALMDPGDKVFKCHNLTCLKETCRYCKEEWNEHFGKRCDEIEKKDEVKLRLQYEEKMTEAKIRTCHKCKAKFTKLDGCNKMTCRCGAKMCYICRKPNIDYDHFCRHFRDPNKGKACTECSQCSLWTNPEQDDERAVAEIKKEAEETRKAMGYTEERLIGAPDEPPTKKKRIGPPEIIQAHVRVV